MLKINNIKINGINKIKDVYSLYFESFANTNVIFGIEATEINVFIDNIYIPVYNTINYNFTNPPTYIEISGKIENIITLNLSNLSISGDLPFEIRYLTNIQNLILSNNNFNNNLHEINHLHNLISLEIISNNFTGNFPTINHTNLKFLALSNNNFTGHFPNLNSSIVTLDAANNTFSSVGDFSIETSSLYDSNDCYINFSNNDLNQLSIDNIISNCLQSEPHVKYSKTLLLNDGTNSPPSSSGLSDISQLLTYGWTVLTN